MRQRRCQHGRLPACSPTLGWVIAAMIAAIGSGCSGTANVATAGSGDTGSKTVTIGVLREPGTLNPYLANGGWSAGTVAQATSDPWIAVDDEGKYQPVIASRLPTLANGGIQMVRDKMVMHVDIDSRAKWSDGAPITCGDMRFTWKTVMDSRWAIGSRRAWDQIATIECPTALRASISFIRPYAPYINILRTSPMPEHALKGRNLENSDDVYRKVVSGPFHLKHWQRGVQLTLTRNTYYWRGDDVHGNVQRLQYRFFRGENALNLQLASGEVDVVQRQLASTSESIHSVAPHLRVQRNRSMSVHAIGMQTAGANLRSPIVRRAVAAAIDRSMITEKLLGKSFAIAQSTLVPEQTPWFIPAWKDSPYPDKATHLMDSAGFAKQDGWWTFDSTRVDLTLAISNDQPVEQRLALLLREQLQAAGFHVVVRVESPQLLYGNTLVAGSYDLAIIDILDGGDPDQRGLLSCDKAHGYNNPYRYCNADVTRWLEQAQTTLDDSLRATLMHKVQKQVAIDMPIFPLYQDETETLSSRRVHRVNATPFASVGWNIADWTVDA